MRKPQSAAIYLRISQDRTGQALGVRRQEQDTLALAERLGWQVGEVYVENDTSASKGARRPVYQRMLADVESGARDGILVYSCDRLTRRLSELATFLDWRAQHDVPFVTTEGDDSTTSSGRMIIGIKASVAQGEAERISERVARKWVQKAEAGLPHGNRHRPYGFGPDRITHVPAEVKVIRQAVDRVLAGTTLTEVIADLRRRNVPTATGTTLWQRGALRSMLLNPRLAGLRVHQGQVVGKGVWAPIITVEQHEALVAMLTGGDGRPFGWGSRAHLLTGLLVCGCCGTGMNSSTRSYQCVKDRGGCGSVAVNIERTDGLVEELMRLRMERAEIEVMPQDDSAELDAEITRLAQKIEAIQGAYDADELDTIDYARSMKVTRAKLTEATRARAASTASRAQVHAARGSVAWDTASLAQRRSILGLRIESIVVAKADKRGGRFDPARISVVWR